MGRCAGWLFLAGALASAPANQLLSDPEPGWYMHLINVLALISGLVCLRLRWDRLPPVALHFIPPVATLEIVLTVAALGVHGEIYLWYFVLGAVFTGYAYRVRWQVAAHMAFATLGFTSTAIFSFGWDPDALVRVVVATPTLAVAAAVVTWLREGLEARERMARRLFEEREREARTDALTGLANRRALMECLAAAAVPAAPPRTLALFDLDGFKLYNDRLGHPAGDALLERVSRRLTDAVGGDGIAFRLGGDEFCVLVDGCDHASAAIVAACAAALHDGEGGLPIAASWGTAAIPTQADSPSAALSAADRAMYAGKDHRRRSARRHGSDLGDLVTASLAADELRVPETAPASPRDPQARPAS